MKIAQFKRAASEAVIARMVARVFGVPGSDHWHEVAQRVSDSDASENIPWSFSEMRLYPWMPDVRFSLTHCKKNDDLIVTLVADVGTVFLVNDSGISGKEGLWMIVADDAGNGDNNAGYAAASAPVFMIVNHAFFPDNTYTIVAIQLTSCQRQ